MRVQTAAKQERVKFYVEKQSFWVQASVIFMALSAAFRLFGCWGLWEDSFFAVSQIALPLCCNILFILCVLLLGKKALWSTALPALLGVAFFIIKAFTFDNWIHTLLCLLLYLLVAVLYTGTVFGFIRTKWLLAPLFGLPFLYHVLVEDMAALRDTARPVSLAAGMQELSVLCIMLSLLFLSFAMKKHRAEKPGELPKIKDPKVIPPAPEPAAGTPAQDKTQAEAPAAEPEKARPAAPGEAK